MRKLFLAALMAFCMVCPAQADGVEIKGISVGMSKEDFNQALARGAETVTLCNPAASYCIKQYFTVAGVRSAYPIYDIDSFTSGGKFENNRLVKWTFFFRAVDFDTVVEGVKAKYPGLKCKNSTVSNGFGAQFPQTMCVYADLWLYRRIDRDAGALILSDRSVEESEAANKLSKARRDM